MFGENQLEQRFGVAKLRVLGEHLLDDMPLAAAHSTDNVATCLPQLLFVKIAHQIHFGL
jgi:hypothetical protein